MLFVIFVVSVERKKVCGFAQCVAHVATVVSTEFFTLSAAQYASHFGAVLMSASLAAAVMVADATSFSTFAMPVFVSTCLLMPATAWVVPAAIVSSGALNDVVVASHVGQAAAFAAFFFFTVCSERRFDARVNNARTAE